MAYIVKMMRRGMTMYSVSAGDLKTMETALRWKKDGRLKIASAAIDTKMRKKRRSKERKSEKKGWFR